MPSLEQQVQDQCKNAQGEGDMPRNIKDAVRFFRELGWEFGKETRCELCRKTTRVIK